MRIYVNLYRKQDVFAVCCCSSGVEICCCYEQQRLQILPCSCLFYLIWAFPLSCPSKRLCLLQLFQPKSTIIIGGLLAWQQVMSDKVSDFEVHNGPVFSLYKYFYSSSRGRDFSFALCSFPQLQKVSASILIQYS